MCNATTSSKQKKPVELADVFNMHIESYCSNNILTPEQHKVINAIRNCRTSVLGGHAQKCDHCSEVTCAYNSCRNRHCPKCETFKSIRWLDNKQEELLPVKYFHVVFTLPHELNNLILYNKRWLYNLLFLASWETLKKLGTDKNRLNGEMGALAVLHTWSQTMSQHNHLHCIVPGGALQSNWRWVKSKNYLFPVKVLSKLFRGIYISKLRELYNQELLKFPDELVKGYKAENFEKLLANLMSKNWVVYAKEPFAGPEQLLNYLCRYTHKIAISNYRIISCNDTHVTFKWRDYSDNNKMKIMTLEAHEFIRRFLSHVVPLGFMRIRSFGFLSNASKSKKLEIIRRSIKAKPFKKDKSKNKDAATLMLEFTGRDITICPACKIGKLITIGIIPSKFNKVIYDTS